MVSYINRLTDTFGGPQRIRRDQLSPSLLATAQFCQTDHPGTVVRRSSLNRISMAIVRSSLRSRWTSYPGRRHFVQCQRIQASNASAVGRWLGSSSDGSWPRRAGMTSGFIGGCFRGLIFPSSKLPFMGRFVYSQNDSRDRLLASQLVLQTYQCRVSRVERNSDRVMCTS